MIMFLIFVFVFVFFVCKCLLEMVGISFLVVVSYFDEFFLVVDNIVVLVEVLVKVKVGMVVSKFVDVFVFGCDFFLLVNG